MKHEDFVRNSFMELIAERKFSWVSRIITNTHPHTPDRLWNDYKKFSFDEDVSSEEAIKRMRAEGYEPANSHELLLWNGWNEEDTVFALGSLLKIGDRNAVLFLYEFWSRQYLGFNWWNNIWIAYNCHFLGVRPSASLGTGKSSDF